MTRGLLRLATAIALLVLAGAAPPLPPEASALPETSALIATPQKLISSDRIDAIDPVGAEPITLWTYDADFRIENHLAGPDVGKQARISFVDQREWRPGKLFMIVHRDGRGRLWARRAWQEVGSNLCLSQQQVLKLGLLKAFAKAEHNESGQRCINV